MLTLFFVCLGLSLMVGQLPGGKWFLKQTKNAVLRPLKAGWKAIKTEAGTIFQNFWHNHRTRVWSFFLGAGIAGIATSPIGFWWSLAILMLALGGLLAGMAFCAWRDALDDFIDWLRGNSLWLWTHYGIRIRWGIAGAIATAILNSKFIRDSPALLPPFVQTLHPCFR